MPQATAGQEFPENDTYSFKVNATTADVQNFYNEQLPALGWNQAFSFPVQAEGGVAIYNKDTSVLTITMAASEGSVAVVLMIAQQ